MAANASWGIKAELDYIRQLRWSNRLKERNVSFIVLLYEYIKVHEHSELRHHLAGVVYAKQLLARCGIGK